MSGQWEKWQGQVIDGVFPLQRFLGASDHSAVFLTELARRQPSAAAIKVVTAGPGETAVVDSRIARWRIASGLAHPHLLTLLDIGRGELDGLPCAYVVMEYADQTLAQLLLHRALTEDEAREMLVPALDALAFLHGRGFVHGGLKPPNVLVVGEKLKLASDTVGRVTGSPASDIQALGRTLIEAITRRAPEETGRSADVALPENVSSGFREIIARCLSSRSEDRPDVAALRGWVEGRKAPSLRPGPGERRAAASRTPAPRTPAPGITATRIPAPRAPESGELAPAAEALHAVAARPTEPVQEDEAASTLSAGVPPTRESARPSERRALIAVGSAVAVVVVMAWIAMHRHRSTDTPAPPPTAGEQRPPDATSPPAVKGASAQAAESSSAPGAESSSASAAQGAPASAEVGRSAPAARVVARAPVHQSIPAVPLSARQTIQGHLQVWVRVSVDREGRVFAARADRPGPSRYFERLAIESARKWTFPPVSAPPSRLMQVRFEFSRSGTTGRAVALP